jgi:hypothetical protein
MRNSGVSQRKLTAGEIRLLQDVLLADYKSSSIRLRAGEYQYDLAKEIASFQLRLLFPDVKDIIRSSYGEEKANDIQFIRKIQTILKKMEKSNIVKILPKKTPWELQRYAISSFKFQDSDKNRIVLVEDPQVQQLQTLLQSVLNQKETRGFRIDVTKAKLALLILTVVASYSVIFWDMIQPMINPIIIIPFFSLAAICSLMIGKLLSRS